MTFSPRISGIGTCFPAMALVLALQPAALGQLEASEEAKFIALPDEDKDAFGWAVAIDGEVAAVGAPQPGIHWISPRPGFVVVHEQGPKTWTATDYLKPSNGQKYDHFGYALDLMGDTLVVGAPQPNYGGPTGPGKVYVFERTVGGWLEMAEIAAAAPLGDMDLYGYALVFDGARLFVGAPAHGAGYPGGRVHVVRKDPGGWVEEAVLVASDTKVTPDGFGSSVDAYGDTLVVGAPGVAAAYVFERNGNAWTEVQKLAGAGDFGKAVAIDGDQLLVGAPRLGGAAEGRVHAFERGATWQPAGILTHSNVVPFDGFGGAIALEDGVAVIGAHQDYHYPPAKGKAYLFERGPGGWSEVLELSGSNAEDASGTGWSVAHDDRRILLGAPYDEPLNHRSGSAFVLAVRPPYERFCNADPSSLGEPAVLRVFGTENATADGLALEVSPAPAGEPGVFLLDAKAKKLSLPGGKLCLWTPHRLSMSVVTANGRLLGPVDLSAPPANQVTAGSTWHFQAWFRDPASAAGYGLSTAASVTFR